MSEFLTWLVWIVGGVLGVYTIVRVASAAFFQSLKQHKEEIK